MTISGGANVYPSEVESVVLRQSGVAEVAVVGIDASRRGDVHCRRMPTWVIFRPSRAFTVSSYSP